MACIRLPERLEIDGALAWLLGVAAAGVFSLTGLRFGWDPYPISAVLIMAGALAALALSAGFRLIVYGHDDTAYLVVALLLDAYAIVLGCLLFYELVYGSALLSIFGLAVIAVGIAAVVYHARQMREELS